MIDSPDPAAPAPAPKPGRGLKETAKPAAAPPEKAAETAAQAEAASFASPAPPAGPGDLGGAAKTDEVLEAAATPALALGEAVARAMDAKEPKAAAQPGADGGPVLTGAFGFAERGLVLVEASSRKLQAASEASKVLARGAQDASRAWMELTQNRVRANLEAFAHLTQARSLPEVMAVQSQLVRDSLHQAMAAGEEIARVSTDAICEATRVMQPES
jgi:hypothetical protein